MIPGEEGLADLLAVQEQIPKSGSLPIGRYRLNVVRAENLPAINDKKRQVTYVMQVIESLPQGFEGHEHTERFTLGTDSDPSAKDPQTLIASDNWGAIAWRRFREAIGAGVQLCATVEGRTTNDGNVYNSLRALYPPTVKLAEIAPPSSTPRAAKSKSGVAVKPAPTTFEVAQGVAEGVVPPVVRQEVIVPCGMPGCGKRIPKSQVVAHFKEHDTPGQPGQE